MEAVDRIMGAMFILCWLRFFSSVECQTEDRFYRETCPQVEKIIANSVNNSVLLHPRLAAGLIRLHFHDCFVNGCDASILLDTTPSGEPVEKTLPANGFSSKILECVDQVKADGVSSSAMNVAGNLPSPSDSVQIMAEMFTRKGLSVEDLVALSGAHSIGHTHCNHLHKRIYNYSSTQAQDPSMDMAHYLSLKSSCPKPGGALSKEVTDKLMVPLEPSTPLRLDTVSYTQLLNGKGVLQSDQALTNDPTTDGIVERFAQNPLQWAARFTDAMIRLGKVDVLTGQEGEIRRNCRAVN